MKKRYRISLDYEIEIKDFKDVHVMRNDWPPDASGKYIVAHLICIREFFAKIMENPEVLDAYLRFRVLTNMAEGGIDTKDINSLTDVETDEVNILRLIIENLDDKILRHFTEANWVENVFEATVPLWNAFMDKMVGLSIEEMGV